MLGESMFHHLSIKDSVDRIAIVDEGFLHPKFLKFVDTYYVDGKAYLDI
jgi:hypothetical protein